MNFFFLFVEDGALASHLVERYADWDESLGREILAGRKSLAELADGVEKNGLDPQPRSGRQEWLENLVGRYL